MTAAPWERLPAELADELRRRMPETAAAVAGAVAATPPFTTVADDKFRRDLDAAVLTALDSFVALIGTGSSTLPPSVHEAFVSLGAAEAREERGPEALLAALRSAARVLFRTGAATLAASGHVEPDTLIDLGDAINAYVDGLANASTDGYARQVREQAGEGDRRRHHLGELLLRGNAAPDDVAAAAAAIGWPPLGDVVAVLLPLEHARDARFRVRAGVVVERERDAVLLLGNRAAVSLAHETLRDRGIVIGPALGWREVPDGVRLAERTAELGPSSSAPRFVDDHLAALALRGVPGALAILTARRLAPLDGVRASQRDNLLTTLRAWLRHWGSRSGVSEELYVHPQTVSYRIRRLRELFGDDLDDPTARFELSLVLSASPPSARPS